MHIWQSLINKQKTWWAQIRIIKRNIQMSLLSHQQSKTWICSVYYHWRQKKSRGVWHFTRLKMSNWIELQIKFLFDYQQVTCLINRLSKRLGINPLSWTNRLDQLTLNAFIWKQFANVLFGELTAMYFAPVLSFKWLMTKTSEKSKLSLHTSAQMF